MLTVISNLFIVLGVLLGLGLLSIGLDYMDSEAESNPPIIDSPVSSDGGGEVPALPF